MRDDRMTACAEYFDHHSAAFAENRYDWYRELRSGTARFSGRRTTAVSGWSSGWRNSPKPPGTGGRSRREFGPRAEAAAGCEHGAAADGIGYDGLFAPPMPNGRQLLQADPPQWRTVRRALAPALHPAGRAGVAHARTAARRRLRRPADRRRPDRLHARPRTSGVDPVQPGTGRTPRRRLGDGLRNLVALSPTLAQNDPRWADLAVALEAESQRIERAIDHHEDPPRRRRHQHPPRRAGRGHRTHRADIHELAQLVIAAGLDTTAALVGSAVVVLANLPALRGDLARNPELLDEALEEFTRLGTPTQGLLRTVTRDVEVGGCLLRRGERVMLCFGAADRDPRVFADPDAFAFGRPARRSVAFGAGIHKSPGDPLRQDGVRDRDAHGPGPHTRLRHSPGIRAPVRLRGHRRRMVLHPGGLHPRPPAARAGLGHPDGEHAQS
ncbi:cytochrome P450 [Yinghuangia aomiensis]